jgi:hypothetical protein
LGLPKRSGTKLRVTLQKGYPVPKSPSGNISRNFKKTPGIHEQTLGRAACPPTLFSSLWCRAQGFSSMHAYQDRSPQPAHAEPRDICRSHHRIPPRSRRPLGGAAGPRTPQQASIPPPTGRRLRRY